MTAPRKKIPATVKLGYIAPVSSGTLHYSESLQLLTDFYQITMAYGYWKNKCADKPAVFNLFFRSNPFKGGFAVAAGLDWVIEVLKNFRFTQSDIKYLEGLNNSSLQPLFESAFLHYLEAIQFQCDVLAVPEGSVVFPNEPLVQVRGPLLQCQLIESILLNIINFQTLIATKAARVDLAAHGAPVIEFGMRRAQGIDGALAASRAAFIGGAGSTSNVLAGKLFGIPVKGTHAHSWIMAHDSELESFRAFADAMPDQCVLLVDTYHTPLGIEHAIKVAKEMAAKGKKLFGVRLDSGDLAYLSQLARKSFDQAGLQEVKIIASNELDERIIESLRLQNACIDIYGVGTKLVTAYEQPALNGIYKLSAIWNKDHWRYKLKISDQPTKTTNPGILRTRRYYDRDGWMAGDLLYDESEKNHQDRIIDPVNPSRSKIIDPSWKHEELLVPIFKKGKAVYQSPSLHQIQRYAQEKLGHLHPGVKRFENPHEYPVGLSRFLSELKTQLIRDHATQSERPPL